MTLHTMTSSTYAVGDRVILNSDELGNLAGIIKTVTQWGMSGKIVHYRVDTIHGPMPAWGRDLAPAGNVVVLRHRMDTLPSEMDVLP